MIPARFYLSSEALQGHMPRASLDPAQYKPTSQLVMEVVAATASEASTGSQAGNKAKTKKKNSEGGAAKPAADSPQSREDLRLLLEQKISALKDERRKKQSEIDKAKYAKEKEA